MFEYLTKFDKILVTGPARSGTRVCARMIAHDTGHRYVDEWEIGIGVRHGGLIKLCQAEHKFVVHCPAWFHHIKQADGSDTAIVVIYRDPQDTSASRHRSGHGGSAHAAQTIADLYTAWEERIKPFIHNSFEIQYEDLSAHPMWVSKEERRQMHWWRIDQIVPSGPTLLLIGSQVDELATKLSKGSGVHLFVSTDSDAAHVTYDRMVHYAYFVHGAQPRVARAVVSMGGRTIVAAHDWQGVPDYIHMVITGDVEETLLRLGRGKRPSEIVGLAWRDRQGEMHVPFSGPSGA